MNLRQFIDLKYAGKVYALTRAEAKLLGLEYPLPHGWVAQFGDMQLSEEMLMSLREIAICRALKTHKDKKAFGKVKKQFEYARNIDLFVQGGEK